MQPHFFTPEYLRMRHEDLLRDAAAYRTSTAHRGRDRRGWRRGHRRIR